MIFLSFFFLFSLRRRPHSQRHVSPPPPPPPVGKREEWIFIHLAHSLSLSLRFPPYIRTLHIQSLLLLWFRILPNNVEETRLERASPSAPKREVEIIRAEVKLYFPSNRFFVQRLFLFLLREAHQTSTAQPTRARGYVHTNHVSSFPPPPILV